MTAIDRAAPFLRGDLFTGHFTPHGRQARFHLGRLQFETVESLDPETIWVQCDVLPSVQLFLQELICDECVLRVRRGRETHLQRGGRHRVVVR